MNVGKTKEQIQEWFKETKSKEKKPFTEITDPEKSTGQKKIVGKPKAKVLAEWKITSLLTFEQRQRYEWFCAGFLAYYDSVVRNGAIDHTISFKWTKNKVKVFINPPPLKGEKNSDINPATSSFTSDPPKPPPPPPPPMS
jgi:hypothetical protein